MATMVQTPALGGRAKKTIHTSTYTHDFTGEDSLHWRLERASDHYAILGTMQSAWDAGEGLIIDTNCALLRAFAMVGSGERFAVLGE